MLPTQVSELNLLDRYYSHSLYKPQLSYRKGTLFLIEFCTWVLFHLTIWKSVKLGKQTWWRKFLDLFFFTNLYWYYHCIIYRMNDVWSIDRGTKQIIVIIVYIEECRLFSSLTKALIVFYCDNGISVIAYMVNIGHGCHGNLLKLSHNCF